MTDHDSPVQQTVFTADPVFTAKSRVHRNIRGPESVGTAPEVYVLPLGYVMDGERVKRLEAPYVEDERGFKEGSPCHAWLEAFNYGRPYIKTHNKTLSVLKLIAQNLGKRGHVYQLCKHRDCVNPKHLGSSHYWKHQKKDPETGRFV